ncbi:MAG: hypothetical protein JWR05_3699, partial [Mucilaginibacter sp.]|nr:hypothetical protein [Mucilaginibacter sp.]
MTAIDMTKPGANPGDEPARSNASIEALPHPTTSAGASTTRPGARVSPLVALTGERKPVTLDTSVRIRPEWQKDMATAWATTRLFLHRNLYRARRQAFYSPVYLGLLLMYAPRGLGRLVAALSRYLYDYDSAAVRHTHAGNVETPEYQKAQVIRKANLKARWMVAGTLIVALLVPVLAWTFPGVLAVLLAGAAFV